MIINPVCNKIDAVLDELRQKHPILRRRGTVSMDETIIELVRKQLQQCSWDNLWSIAATFDVRKLLACFEIVVSDREGDVAEKAAEIIKQRPRDRFIEQGWFRLVVLYPHPLLEKLVKKLIEERGFKVLEQNKKVSDRVPRWFISTSLSAGVLDDYEQEDHENLSSFLSVNFLNEEHGLYKAVWREMLSKGSAASIKKESAKKVLEEFKKPENAQYLEEFCSNYLNQLKTIQNWTPNILEFIENKFGSPEPPDPNEPIETPFWKKILPPVKQEFRQWQMLREIQSFFEGERANFWRKYVEKGLINQVTRMSGVGGFMLDFGHFGVIEFKSVGNAAYVYPRDVFKSFWLLADYSTNPGYYKDRTKTIRHRHYPFWDGRIIHGGGWQDDTDKKINSLLKSS